MNTANDQEKGIYEETHRAVLKMMRKERKQIKKEVKHVERQKEEERKKLELKFGPTDNRVRIISREFASKLIDSHKSQTNNCEFLQLTPNDFPSLDQNVYKSKDVTDVNCSTFENGVTTERCASSSVDINVSKPTETNVPSPEPMNTSGEKNYNVLGDPNDIDMSALGELDFIFTEVVPKKPKRKRGKRGAGSRKRRPRYRIKYDQVSENCINADLINLIESNESNQPGFTELIQSASKELNQCGPKDLNQSGFTELIQSASKELNQCGSKDLNQSGFTELIQSASKELNQCGSKDLNQSGFTELIQSASKELNQSGFRKLIQFGFKELKQSASKEITVSEGKELNFSEAKEPNLSRLKNLHLSQPIRFNLSGRNQFNLYKPEELNLPGPNAYNLSQPTELNLPGPNKFNLYNPDEFNIPGLSEFNLSQPTELNPPGVNQFNLYKPEELYTPGPNEFNLSQPKELSTPGPSKFNSSVNLSEPNKQVIKKTKRVNFGPVTVNILDIIQKSKSQLKKEELLKREADNVGQRTRKFRQREAKKNARYEGNMLDASQPDRQRGKHREFAKEKKPSKLKQLIQRDAAEAKEEDEESEVEPFGGKPKYSEFHINYSNNVITQELDSAVTAFLTNIVQFQENLYERDQIKGDTRRRYYVGFRVVRRFLLKKKIKILIVSPDIKAKQRGDTLDNMINNIVSLAAASEIPYVFALSRRKMGQITLKNVPICCVAVTDCDGTEKEFQKVLELIQVTRDEYQKTKPKPLDAQEEQTKEIIDDFLSFV